MLACLKSCVLTVQLDTNTYLNNHRGTVGVTRHRNTCYFVGAMLCSIFNFLLILVLGAFSLWYFCASTSPGVINTGVLVITSSYTHPNFQLFVLSYMYVLRARVFFCARVFFVQVLWYCFR